MQRADDGNCKGKPRETHSSSSIVSNRAPTDSKARFAFVQYGQYVLLNTTTALLAMALRTNSVAMVLFAGVEDDWPINVLGKRMLSHAWPS